MPTTVALIAAPLKAAPAFGIALGVSAGLDGSTGTGAATGPPPPQPLQPLLQPPQPLSQQSLWRRNLERSLSNKLGRHESQLSWPPWKPWPQPPQPPEQTCVRQPVLQLSQQSLFRWPKLQRGRQVS